MEKVCTKCLIKKNLSEYHNNCKAKDGKSSWCKECSIISSKEINKNNKDKTNAARRLRRIENSEWREKINRYKMLLYWKNREKSLYIHTKSSSKRRKLEFNLDLEDIIFPPLCPILNVPFDKNRYSPSIDRIDNSKGYIKGNIWIISKQANKMKNNGTFEELILFCKNIPKYIQKIN